MYLHPKRSNIDWEYRASMVQVDFDALWNDAVQVREERMEDTPAESIQYYWKTGVENLHQLLRIDPVRNVENATGGQKHLFVATKIHMFRSELWNASRLYYERNGDSFHHYSIQVATEDVREKIRQALPDDVHAQALYMHALERAAADVQDVFVEALTEGVVESLDSLHRDVALLEARSAVATGLISGTSLDTDDDLLLEFYVEEMMERLHV